MKKSEYIALNEEEVNALLGRVSNCSLEDSDKKLITGIIQIHQLLQRSLREARISIKRLRSLFGFKQTEKRDHLHPSQESSEEQTAEPGLGEKVCDQLGNILSQALESLKGVKNSLQKVEKKKGHGRLGHKDYPGATVVTQEHESLKTGDPCPESCGGKLYALEPKVMVCLTGHALASATKYFLERLRCALCGKVFTAEPRVLINRRHQSSTRFSKNPYFKKPERAF